MKNNIPFVLHIYKNKDKRINKRAKFKYLDKVYKIFDNGQITFIKLNRKTIKSINEDIYFVFDNFKEIIK